MSETLLGWSELEEDRSLRSDSRRNRNSVVDAMLELIREGNLSPSSSEIADRAGISARSVFRYFDDIDDLLRTAIARQFDRLRPLLALDVPDGADTATKVQLLVDQRVLLFEGMGMVGVVARLRAPAQPLIAAQLAQLRSFLRQQLKRTFADELAEMGAPVAGNVLAVADVVCSFEAHQLLRNDQVMSRSRAASAMVDGMWRLLGVQTNTTGMGTKR